VLVEARAMTYPLETINCGAFVAYSGARIVSDRFYVTGQPTAPAYAAIAQAGIGSVICLRDPDETDPQPPPVPPVPPFDTQEANELAALGVTYQNIVITRTMTQAQFDEMATEAAYQLLVNALATPALIHCSSGDRASSAFAALLIVLGILSNDDAAAYAENCLLLANSAMIAFVKAYTPVQPRADAIRGVGAARLRG
jgi:protein tyrosine phosphatase (PTP) superfamily phosphohydrolase (DUF442 family)